LAWASFKVAAVVKGTFETTGSDPLVSAQVLSGLAARQPTTSTMGSTFGLCCEDCNVVRAARFPSEPSNALTPARTLAARNKPVTTPVLSENPNGSRDSIRVMVDVFRHDRGNAAR